jgi:hypothetical protein
VRLVQLIAMGFAIGAVGVRQIHSIRPEIKDWRKPVGNCFAISLAYLSSPFSTLETPLGSFQ